MREFVKRAASVLVASVLVLGGLGLAGCGSNDPKNAQELLGRYMANESHDNYHCDFNMDYKISMFGQDIPIVLAFSMDMAGDNGHGTLNTDAMGRATESELYIQKENDKYAQYSKGKDDDTWIKTSTNARNAADSVVNDALLSDAEFAKIDEGYTLTVPGDKFMEALSASGLNVTEMFSQLGGEKTVADAFKDSSAVYTFNKDCLLTDLVFIVNFEYSYGEDASTINDETISLKITMDMDMSMKLSDYGTIDEAKVAVPDDVKKNAVNTGDLNEELAELVSGNESSNAESTNEESSD